MSWYSTDKCCTEACISTTR